MLDVKGVPASIKKGDTSDTMAIQRMDNVGIVVGTLDVAISFFAELGLELEGRATVEGDWAERVTGLHPMRVEIAMMRTPDGHSRLELSRFLTPPVVDDHRNAPVNTLGYLRVMFAVDDIDDTLARLAKHGARLVSSEVVQIRRRLSALLHPRAGRTSHRAGTTAQLALHPPSSQTDAATHDEVAPVRRTGWLCG